MLSKCTIHVIIHRKGNYRKSDSCSWQLMKKLPAAKGASILFPWQALLLFSRGGPKFHSVLCHDWFSPVVKQRAAHYQFNFLLSRYGQKKWLSKSECRNILRTYCNLSAETSDYEHQYYARVKAVWGTNCSKGAQTGRFYPFLESK